MKKTDLDTYVDEICTMLYQVSDELTSRHVEQVMAVLGVVPYDYPVPKKRRGRREPYFTRVARIQDIAESVGYPWSELLMQVGMDPEKDRVPDGQQLEMIKEILTREMYMSEGEPNPKRYVVYKTEIGHGAADYAPESETDKELPNRREFFDDEDDALACYRRWGGQRSWKRQGYKVTVAKWTGKKWKIKL